MLCWDHLGLLLNASILAGCERAGLVAHFVVSWAHFVGGLGGGAALGAALGWVGYALAGRQIICKGGCVGMCARHFRGTCVKAFPLNNGGAAAAASARTQWFKLGGLRQGATAEFETYQEHQEWRLSPRFQSHVQHIPLLFCVRFIRSAWGGLR